MNKKQSVNQVSGVKPVLVFKFPMIDDEKLCNDLKLSIDRKFEKDYYVLVVFGGEFDRFDCKMLNGEMSNQELEQAKKIYKDVTTWEPEQSIHSTWYDENIRKSFESDFLDPKPIGFWDRVRSWFQA